MITSTTTTTAERTESHVAREYACQSQRLAQYRPAQESDQTGSTQAVEAKFVTAQDPVIQTANGGRLPAVPLEEATKLNRLKDELEGRDPAQNKAVKGGAREAKDGTVHGVRPSGSAESLQSAEPGAPLRHSVAATRTNPLFPPVALYGPPTLLRNLQCASFRASSAVLSLCFLLVIVLGALFTSIPSMMSHIWCRIKLQDPDVRRPFFEEEQRRKKRRREEERDWARRRKGQRSKGLDEESDSEANPDDEFPPLEGGPDPLVCDVAYYARRVGLDCEKFDVQTEDGFIIELWHLFNPREYHPTPFSQRGPRSPDVFPNEFAAKDTAHGPTASQHPQGRKKYPVLLIHGLLQSAGAYCSNDDDSLAFYLAKSGLDVWLGNNRCGFEPRHNLLSYSDPRMWAWNIRQMGVLDLPALMSRVLSETGFAQLALVAHSQGTTQTLVALAKEQRPDIGVRLSVFCALAPAAYAGPLIGKMYFKLMRAISPGMFRAMFGVHAFIPFMMAMHGLLPARFYGAMGYRVFSFLFDWTDERWERALRDRMFQFAPVYVSAESMRWWLGRECFALQKCILATREEGRMEDREDEEEDKVAEEYYHRGKSHLSDEKPREESPLPAGKGHDDDRGRYAWYDEQVPPMALWVAGADDLVDGRRLLRRFERGREPYVDVVHSKIIEGYEHLDVIWAMDALEKVGKEVKEVIWKTASKDAREVCRVPKGCEEVKPWQGKRRSSPDPDRELGKTNIDATAGEWNQAEKESREERGEELQ